MSHFTVTVELPAGTTVDIVNHVLGVKLEPFSENALVDPYRLYEEGSPSSHWAADSLHEEGLFKGKSITDVLWSELAETYNTRWDHNDEDDPEHIHIDENGRAYTVSTSNPDGKWDWWTVGGRWRGYFLAKHNVPPGAVMLSPKSWSNEGVEVHPRGCDVGPLRHLDLEGTRNLAGDEAAAKIRLYERIIDGLPRIESWNEVMSRVGVINHADARAAYSEQPGIKALKEHDEFMWDCPIEEFQWGEELYVARARASAVPGYAHVTLDGEWMARGEMSWFAMSTETTESTESYDTLVNARLDTLDPDVVLAVVDCHV